MDFIELSEYIDEDLFYSLEKTLESFLDNDVFLIGETEEDNKVYEVAISCKLARYIETYLVERDFFINNSNLVLDTEYDKMGVDKIKKHIDGIKSICGNKTDNIRPDIIIHNRGEGGEENNYCVFEIKKGKLSVCDKTKLEKMTGTELNSFFGYKYGIGISELYSESIKISLYKDGDFIGDFIYNNN